MNKSKSSCTSLIPMPEQLNQRGPQKMDLNPNLQLSIHE